MSREYDQYVAHHRRRPEHFSFLLVVTWSKRDGAEEVLRQDSVARGGPGGETLAGLLRGLGASRPWNTWYIRA